MITLPGYDNWKLSPPPEPTPDPDARLDYEVENADYPPCDTCGGELTDDDKQALSPAEAWDYAEDGGSLCTPCDEATPLP